MLRGYSGLHSIITPERLRGSIGHQGLYSSQSLHYGSGLQSPFTLHQQRHDPKWLHSVLLETESGAERDIKADRILARKKWRPKVQNEGLHLWARASIQDPLTVPGHRQKHRLYRSCIATSKCENVTKYLFNTFCTNCISELSRSRRTKKLFHVPS